MDEAVWDSDDAPQFPGGAHYADDKIEAFLQGSTQYDALGHVWFGGKIWNGYDACTTIGGLDHASIEPIARRGIVGRAVLLDIARWRGKKNLDSGETFTHVDLAACAATQGVEIRRRDILLIRTNYLQLFFDRGEEFFEEFCEPGLIYSPELVQWFADMEIPNLVTDTMANEVTFDPNNGIILPLHNALMRNLGVTFTEIVDLEELAADCAADQTYECFYAAAPLNVAQGSGAPVNPIVVK